MAFVVPPMLLAGWSYRDAVSYSFMYDDPLDLPRALAETPWHMLTSSASYSYYRPLCFLLWSFMHAIIGSFNPIWFHLVPVCVHVVNTALVALLLLPLSRRLGAFAGACAFALYPFDYQAVSWAGSLFHPLVTCFVLIAVLTYRQAQVTGSRFAAIGSLIAAVLALLTHEYGITASALICWYELMWRPRPSARPNTIDVGEGRQPGSRSAGLMGRMGGARPQGTHQSLVAAYGHIVQRWMLAGAHVGLAFGYLLVYRAIPKSHAPFTLDVSSLRLNGLYLVQGLAYWVAAPVGGVPGGATAIILRAATIAIAVMLSFALVQGSCRLFFYGLGWALIAWLPVWLVLHFTYVIDGPRLLYLPSVAVACWWAAAVSLPARTSLPARIAQLCAALLLTVVCLQNETFLLQKARLYVMGSRFMFQVSSAAAAAAPSGGALLVNPISWFGPKRPEYPLGHTGITLVPSYIGLNQVEAVALGHTVPINWTGDSTLKRAWSLDYRELGANPSPRTIVGMARRSGEVFVTRLGTGIALEDAGSIRSSSPPSDTFFARFDNGVALDSATISVKRHRARLTLAWQLLGKSPGDVTVFVHVDANNGRLIAQDDGDPVLGVAPIQFWLPGDTVIDRRYLRLPRGLPPGTYTIGVGLYHRQGGARVPAFGRNGNRLPADTAVIGRMTLDRPLGLVHLMEGG